MVWEFGFGDAINILIFFSLGFSSYVIFYFSRKFNIVKQVTVSTFILALGINLIGLSHLFRIGIEVPGNVFIYISAIVGALCTLIGFILMTFETQVENMKMKQRYEELKLIISNLKEKYYRQEISEDDLKALNTGLIRELAELEVKLKDIIKEKPKKSKEKN